MEKFHYGLILTEMTGLIAHDAGNFSFGSSVKSASAPLFKQ